MVLSLIIGSLRYHDGDGHEKVSQKVNLRSFNLYRDTSTHLLCQMQANSF